MKLQENSSEVQQHLETKTGEGTSPETTQRHKHDRETTVMTEPARSPDHKNALDKSTKHNHSHSDTTGMTLGPGNITRVAETQWQRKFMHCRNVRYDGDCPGDYDNNAANITIKTHGNTIERDTTPTI